MPQQDEFLQARRITSASMSSRRRSGLHRPLADRAAFRLGLRHMGRRCRPSPVDRPLRVLRFVRYRHFRLQDTKRSPHMSNSAIPDLISEDIFRFGPGDRYALPIGTAAPERARALADGREVPHRGIERLPRHLRRSARRREASGRRSLAFQSPNSASEASPTGRALPLRRALPRRGTSSPSALRPSTA